VIAVNEGFYAAAYWAIREEDVGSCADRMLKFLNALGRVHPLLGTWFKPAGQNISATDRPVEQTLDTMRALLLAGRNRGDTDGAVIEDLGFSASLWTGQETAAGLRVGCGMYNRAVNNAVVLNLPPPEGLGLEVYAPRAAYGVMRALADCWEPEWATLISRALRRAQEAPPRSPVVGWMTYLALPRRVDVARLPSGTSAEMLPEGTLVIAGSDVRQVSEETVLAVRAALGDALMPVS
jgi:Immunity protein 52